MTEEATNEWVWDVQPNYPKEKWPPGPWHDEPDKVVWVDEATNLDCMIVRGPSGALCGYVGVPPEHQAHGRDCDAAAGADVHYGVNYAHECQGIICHLPEEGRPREVWWFGFDCAHGSDFCPAFDQLGTMFAQQPHESYKTVAYVKRECENLAHFLAAMSDE